MTTPLLTVVFGPTAVGKSDYAIELALEQGADILCADAFQIYQGMAIGTAQATPEMRARVPHHLVDHVDPFTPYSVADFHREATALLEERMAAGLPTVVCGGNGLYLNALLYGYQFQNETVDTVYQAELQAFFESEGVAALYAKLHAIDPECEPYMDKQNHRRIIRALLQHRQTGEKPSSLRHREHAYIYPVRMLGLRAERAYLLERINLRVDQMFKMGLIEEFNTLVDKGLTASHACMQGVGYKELFQLQDGVPLEKVVELIKIHTRQYAKRQMTWFKRFPNVEWQTISI